MKYQAAEEQDENARPALATHIENLEQYDTILLGYPNWWGDMPQALYTFLEEYDFSGNPFINIGRLYLRSADCKIEGDFYGEREKRLYFLGIESGKQKYSPQIYSTVPVLDFELP